MAFMRLSKPWRKWNNLLHRDMGYFFVGLTIIYGLSGIALNHMDDWDPNYIIDHRELQLTGWPPKVIDKSGIGAILTENDIDEPIKNFYTPSPGQLKVFLKNGSITVNTQSGVALLELVKKRPVFFESNYLHYNHAKGWWTWAADIFAGGLIFLALTGLFMVPGKNSFWRRGVWFFLVGIIIPLILIFQKL